VKRPNRIIKKKTKLRKEKLEHQYDIS